MKKQNYLILIIITVSLITILLGNNIIYKNKPKEIVSDQGSHRKVYSTGISMMLETSADSGEYVETSDTTWAQAIEKGYIFNETMSKCENGSVLTWDETNKTVKFTGNVSDKCYVYFDKVTIASTCVGQNMASCMATNYELDTSIYKHDGVGTYGAYEAGDNSYRFVGANPNNYVCFGSTATLCPNDNLYRIIGIFDNQIKLIKYDYATTDQLGTDGAYLTATSVSGYKGILTSIPVYLRNEYKLSETSLYLTNLNINFKKYLQTAGGKDWTTYIDDIVWKEGGNTIQKIYHEKNAKTVYTNEIVNPATGDTVTTMFGLIYVSDYRYAADPTKSNSWSNLGSDSYSIVHADNWISMGFRDLTISLSEFGVSPYAIAANGDLTTYTNGSIRPCFYLKSSVTLSSGSGTESDPYRLSI